MTVDGAGTFYAAHLLLGLAVACVWLPRFKFRGAGYIALWPFVFLGSVAAGLVTGTLAWSALPPLAALCGAAWASGHAHDRMWRGVLTLVASAIALGLILHLFPGFANPRLFDRVRFTEDAAPFVQYLNFDKGAAGLVILAAYAPRIRTASELRRVVFATGWAIVATAGVVSVVGLTIGYFRFEPKIPMGAPSFLATNLVFTCVAEEAFARGLLQEKLTVALERWPASRWLPVLVSGLMFGAAHAAGGASFVLLASLAGLGYSCAYAMTRRIEAAVATHFAVNAMHFFFFTYPFLAR